MSTMGYEDAAMMDRLGLLERLREATYETGDGRHVYYDDGPGTLRDAADLYTVLSEDHTTGSANLENEQARTILNMLQSGGGLGTVHYGTLQKLLTKHADKIARLRKSPDRDGQDRLDVASAGPDSLITSAPTKEARTMRPDPAAGSLMSLLDESASFDDGPDPDLGVSEALRVIGAAVEEPTTAQLPVVRRAVVQLREAERAEPGTLARRGLDLLELEEIEADLGVAQPRPVRLGVRNAVMTGRMSLMEATSMGSDDLRDYNAGGVPLFEALGFDGEGLS